MFSYLRRSYSGSPERPSAGQQAPQRKKNEPRLAQADAPQNPKRFVAVVVAQGLLNRIVEQIHEAAVVRLLEIMERPAQPANFATARVARNDV
jgi:hypothetical protein